MRCSGFRISTSDGIPAITRQNTGYYQANIYQSLYPDENMANIKKKAGIFTWKPFFL